MIPDYFKRPNYWRDNPKVASARRWCSTKPYSHGGLSWRQVWEDDTIWLVVRSSKGTFYRLWRAGDENIRDDFTGYDEMTKYETTAKHEATSENPIEFLLELMRTHRTISPSGRFQKGASVAMRIELEDKTGSYSQVAEPPEEFSCLEEYILWVVLG